MCKLPSYFLVHETVSLVCMGAAVVMDAAATAASTKDVDVFMVVGVLLVKILSFLRILRNCRGVEYCAREKCIHLPHREHPSYTIHPPCIRNPATHHGYIEPSQLRR